MGEKKGTQALEAWCRRVTMGYKGVKITNMTTSWRDGLAFCAIIHHFRPDLIDFDSLESKDVLKNNELAFNVAARHLGIPQLLDPQDMLDYPVPDRLSILTYLAQFYQGFAGNSQKRPGTPSYSASKVGSSEESTATSANANTIANTNANSSKALPSSSSLPPSPATGPGKVFAKQMFPGPLRREPCFKCQLPVFLAERLMIGRILFHRTCFRCARCSTQLTLNSYYETEKGEYCCETCPDEEVEDSAKDQDTYSEDFELALGEEASTLVKPVQDVPEQSSADKARMNFLTQNLADDTGFWEDERGAQASTVEEPEQGVNFDLKDVSGTGKTKTDQVESDTKVVQSVNSDAESLPSRGSGSFVQDRIAMFGHVPKQVPVAASSFVVEKVPQDLPVVSSEGENGTLLKATEAANNHDSTAQEPTELSENKEQVPPEKAPFRSTDMAEQVLSESEAVPQPTDVVEHSCEKQEPMPPCKPTDAHVVEQVSSGKEEPPCTPIDAAEVSSDEREEIPPCKPIDAADISFDKREEIPPCEVVDAAEVLSDKREEIPPCEPTNDHIAIADEKKEAIPPRIEVQAEGEASKSVQSEESKESEVQEYPDELNPFGEEESLNPFDSDDDTSEKVVDRKTSTLIDEANSSSNPFWSDDDEHSSIENDSDSRPVPKPRILIQPSANNSGSRSITPNPGEAPQPLPRHFLDALDKSSSVNSLTSIGSGTSRKKRPAPQPPRAMEVLQPPRAMEVLQPPRAMEVLQPPRAMEVLQSLPLVAPDSELHSAPKPRLKKSRPAPQPPSKLGDLTPAKLPMAREKKLSPGKLEKELQNRTTQNQNDTTQSETPSSPSKDKSMYGQWKRKKGPAPPRPLPQKRQIRKLPLADIQRELKDIEVKQLELERQGVGIEKAIRKLCEGDNQADDLLVPEAEEAILQLFELVNEKNELFRRETELMYLKREQRLEEEHAELEYQIRCLMDKSEGQKTVEDQIREEELIQRLIQVVEQRNEVVECLELERRREVEEDRSIQFSLHAAQQKNLEREAKVKSHKLNPFRLGRKDKKKEKKKKKKSFDADKDIDESENSAASGQTSHGKEGKGKKKWL